MKSILLLLPLSLLILVGCSGEKDADASADSANGSSSSESIVEKMEKDTEKAGKDIGKEADKVGKDIEKEAVKAKDDVESMASDGGSAAKTVKQASSFSDTISKTWDSMKGMDFAKKAEFVKKGMSLVSGAKDKLSMLNSISSSLPDGMGKKLMDQVGGISGHISSLTGLLGKASSIGAGDWSSYKDQVGSALGLLGGNFSALGSL